MDEEIEGVLQVSAIQYGSKDAVTVEVPLGHVEAILIAGNEDTGDIDVHLSMLNAEEALGVLKVVCAAFEKALSMEDE